MQLESLDRAPDEGRELGRAVSGEIKTLRAVGAECHAGPVRTDAVTRA